MLGLVACVFLFVMWAGNTFLLRLFFCLWILLRLVAVATVVTGFVSLKFRTTGRGITDLVSGITAAVFFVLCLLLTGSLISRAEKLVELYFDKTSGVDGHYKKVTKTESLGQGSYSLNAGGSVGFPLMWIAALR